VPVSKGGLVTPDPVHQLIAREHVPRVGREEPEKVELLRRQLERCVGLAYLARRPVYLQVAEREPSVGDHRRA
jgi:hypothetical protein